MICTKIKTVIPCFYFHTAFKNKIFVNAEIVTREKYLTEKSAKTDI